MTWTTPELLGMMATFTLLGLGFGYNWGRRAMLQLLRAHLAEGRRFKDALDYEQAMLNGVAPPRRDRG